MNTQPTTRVSVTVPTSTRRWLDRRPVDFHRRLLLWAQRHDVERIMEIEEQEAARGKK